MRFAARTTPIRKCPWVCLPRSSWYDVLKHRHRGAGDEQLRFVTIVPSMRARSPSVKLIALPILLTLVLIAFGNSLFGKQSTSTLEVLDRRYAEPFRGSEAGKKLTRACGNCHSNHTNLPWYGHVVPISWWLDRHVRKGRQALNFTEWPMYSARRQRDELQSICGIVSNDRMPPASYRVLHPESRLSPQDKQVICAWAAAELEHKR